LVSTVIANCRSGTKKKSEICPPHDPPCWYTGTPSVVRRRQKATHTPSSSIVMVPPGPGLERIASGD